MTKSDCVNGKQRNFTESQKIVRISWIVTWKNRKKPVFTDFFLLLSLILY